MENITINGYTLKYKLGEGGMAEVWYAENYLQKPAAIKVLQKHFCGMPEIVSRFEKEAKLMVHLNHAHIRSIHDFSMIGDCPCMIMEYLEGKDLAIRLKKGEIFSNKQLISWWDDLVDALQYTHRKNIIHRDIKPSNLFITNAGDIKILDFGIAKLRDDISVTQTGSRMGTLMYMSPEQVYDVKSLSHKTDIYSLAITFYHLITGQAPYDATRISDFEIQENIVRKNIDIQLLPDPWKNILPHYLNKDPESRRELTKLQAENKDETLFYTPPSATIENPLLKSSFSQAQKKPYNRYAYILLSFFIITALIVFAVNKDKVLFFIKSWGEDKNIRKENLVKQRSKRTTNTIKKKSVALLPDTTLMNDSSSTNDQVVSSIGLAKKTAQIKNELNEYYITRSNCGELSRFFRDTVIQYYNKSNETLQTIQKECEAYHNKWKYTEANINDESYVITYNDNGNVYVDFNMLYKIKEEAADDWIPYSIDVSVIFNIDMKITKIVERRIEKL